MEIKKTKKANIEKNRIIFLEIGMLLVLSFILIAFERATPLKSTVLEIPPDDNGPDGLAPITRQKEKQPEPPPPPIDILDIVDNDKEFVDQPELDDQEAKPDSEMPVILLDDEKNTKEEVFIIVQEMPKFKGGDKNTFSKWIQENLIYPRIAIENSVSGRVFVQFAVNSKGMVVDVKVIKGADPALDKEALRVVKSSPKWEPGKQRGKPVKVQFTFPIYFALQ